jgi:hypothetical protein
MAEVYTGSRRYAVPFPVVANAAHGLRQYAQLRWTPRWPAMTRLGRVADAGDQVGASLDEAKRQLALTEKVEKCWRGRWRGWTRLGPINETTPPDGPTNR